MQAKQILENMRQQIANCKDCPLSSTRLKTVPGEGPADSPIMLIGEGPGHNENQQGKPFVGQAGFFLDELLAQAGLKREDVFITNVVKCRPPGNRDPQPEELSACRKYLDAQIEAINPRIIVTLGRFSMARFIDNGKISRIHGQVHHVEGRLVVTMYHPAAALHQPALKTALLEDFAQLRRLLDEPAKLPAAEKTKPTLQKTEEKPPEQLSLF